MHWRNGTACFMLQVMCYELRVTSYKLQVTSYGLQVTSYKLQVASCKLQVTSYKLQVTSYKLHAYFKWLTRTTCMCLKLCSPCCPIPDFWMGWLTRDVPSQVLKILLPVCAVREKLNGPIATSGNGYTFQNTPTCLCCQRET